MLLLGIAAGVVWQQLASPAQWQVRETGIVLTEAASTGSFSVIVTFVAVGAVASLLLGCFLAVTLRELGWVTTPVLIAATLVAGVVAWRVGVQLGPPDPATVRGLSVGDRVPSELAVDTVWPFLIWPIFGLVGLIVTTMLAAARDEQHPRE
ncbi:hypothetical protein C6I20_05780 [Aeromicrobium sp. A1-2]|uniref:hypothetical protein n=1 Tax=Aeromicrobium sp. A1-2 TaxID=2107713 RepID=UPI000E499486|nr:hypothetical protein [Aeromicrobium sp. A1-2]AXT84752.1 hypothetical protein C6I20_05780 [Aeromicrobium sp. A1-2]